MEQLPELIIYTAEDGTAKVDVTFDHDTVWLSTAQMADLFQKDRSVISKHIKNVFEEGELQEKGNVRQAERGQVMAMRDWAKHLDHILTMSGENF